MTRRPTASIDGALGTIQAWMEDTKRVVDALRDEVEQLRRERVELNAQLRFLTAQANREAIAAASLKEELDSVRSLPMIRDSDVELDVDVDDMGGDTMTDALPRMIEARTLKSATAHVVRRLLSSPPHEVNQKFASKG